MSNNLAAQFKADRKDFVYAHPQRNDMTVSLSLRLEIFLDYNFGGKTSSHSIVLASFCSDIQEEPI